MLRSIFNLVGPARLVAAGLAFSVLLGCQSNPTGDRSGRFSGENSAIDTLRFHDTTIRKFSPYLVENDGQIDTTVVELTLPKFDDTLMNQIVTDNILLEGEADMEQFMNNFLEGYGNFVEENDIRYPLAWNKTTEIKVGFHTPELMVIKNSTYEFTGGAHGNSFQIWNVYDVENYRKLPFNTFVPDDKLKDFTKIAEKFFRQHENLSDSTNLEEAYFFEDGIFKLAGNYGISEAGIEFHYNPYEIKPYVAGSTTFTVPVEAITDCLTETGKNYFRNITSHINSTR